MTKLLMKSKTINYDLGCVVCGLFISAFSLAMVLYFIPVWCSIGSGLSTIRWNSQTMPYVVSILFFILGLFIALRHWKTYRKSKQDGTVSNNQRSFYFISLVIIVIGFLYVILFQYIGYIPTTLVTMAALYFLFGGKKWWAAAIFSIVFTAIMVLFFYGYLRLAMPLVWFV